ncbi:MAG: carboxylating nicotinate-nucleotide diphosphorylase [Verrucomicrobiae bacterium]|nr:carboxylating nicotinate-nucleotide diphosphorylase [Verrucomicrobiae bacterium]
MKSFHPDLQRVIRRIVGDAILEDLDELGDVTSLATIPPAHRSTAHLISRENGILCGVEVAAEVFRQRDPSAKIRLMARDGTKIHPGQEVLKVDGHSRSLLSAERVALNFIQRLSGVATLTRQYVEKVEKMNRKTGRHVRILDTRKTTPMLRGLEKYAVTRGGGVNHRMGLFDQVLIKDNHLTALIGHCECPVVEAVSRARHRWPKLKVEIECETLKQVKAAIAARPDIIMFDNMTLAQMRQAVRLIGGRAKVEASGGITLKRVAAVAATGVDFISVGALTHSAFSVDFTLDFKPRKGV